MGNYMSYETLIFEKREAYALIYLNRPDKLNALNNKLLHELEELIKIIENDKEIRAVIIIGSGEKAFAAGADISELHACDDTSGVQFSEYGNYVFRRLEQLNKLVVAAVNGFALGGGCELAMACHIRFASDKAKFGQPEVNLGVIPGYGGTQRLPALVGRAKAIELIVSGVIINADEALQIGLVNRVFAHDELLDKTIEFVNLVLSKGREAVENSINCIKMSEKLSLSDGLRFEAQIFGKVCGTENFKEGTKAYLEKRPANFN